MSNGRLTYTHGYGSEDLDYKLPLSDSSSFYLGSVAKQFDSCLDCPSRAR